MCPLRLIRPKVTNMTKLLVTAIQLLCVNVVLFQPLVSAGGGATSNYDVQLPTKCESCKFLARELEFKLKKTGKTNEVLHGTKSEKKYRDSELRFLETMENLCDVFLDYNVHKEYTDSRRFAKGTTQTMQTLKNLRNKGVKVDIGIPHDLWEAPSVEVSSMKNQCESIVEEYEEELEKWFFDERKVGEKLEPLEKFLCRDRVLVKSDNSCLNEQLLENNGKEKGDHEEL